MPSMHQNAMAIRQQLRSEPDRQFFKKGREKLLEIAMQMEAASDQIVVLQRRVDFLESTARELQRIVNESHRANTGEG